MSTYVYRRKGKKEQSDSVLEIVHNESGYVLYSNPDPKKAIVVIKGLESGLSLEEVLTNDAKAKLEANHTVIVNNLELQLICRQKEFDAMTKQYQDQIARINHKQLIPKLLPDEIKTREYADYITNSYHVSADDALELAGLCRELKPHNFIDRNTLKKYFECNKLGERYPNITGDLDMVHGNTIGTMKDAVKTNLYHVVCSEIGFTYQRSQSRPCRFTSNHDLNRYKR